MDTSHIQQQTLAHWNTDTSKKMRSHHLVPTALLLTTALLASTTTTGFQTATDLRSVVRTSPRKAEFVPPSTVSDRQSSSRLLPNNLIHRRQSASTTALQSALLSTALAAVDSFWKTSPYAAAAIVCGIKASAADFVAQHRQFRKEASKAQDDETAAAAAAAPLSVTSSTGAAAVPLPQPKVDKLRNLAYLIYGAVYQGITQEYVYNHLYPAMFGPGTDILTVLTKVCFDLFVQTILVTLPIAYLSKALIFRYSAREAFRRYADDIRNHGLLTKYFTLWGPVQCITFSIIPEHFRVTFIAAVSFFWLIILSSIASKKRPTKGEDDGTMMDDCPMEDGLTCDLEFKD
jgi:protein Mpv17